MEFMWTTEPTGYFSLLVLQGYFGDEDIYLEIREGEFGGDVLRLHDWRRDHVYVFNRIDW